jgi:hypothetical protein
VNWKKRRRNLGRSARERDEDLVRLRPRCDHPCLGRPVLDPARHTMPLNDIALDVESGAAFGLLGAAARAAAPHLKKGTSDHAVIGTQHRPLSTRIENP